MAVAIADLAKRSGFAVTVCAPAAEQAAFADADRRIEGFALPVDEAAARYVVVSTQGRGDEAALLAALAVDVDYVAFVGSRKKADALKAALAERGVAADRLAKLKAPAGLDLGAITPDEIAISILAEIVAVRRGKGARGAPARSRLRTPAQLRRLRLHGMNPPQSGCASGLLQGVADFVALFVDRRDHRPGRNAESHQRRFGKLQARFDGLRHRVGGAELIKMTRMVGVPRPRDDDHIGAHGAHMLDHVVDQVMGMDRDDDAGGAAKAADFEKFRIGGVAVIDVMTVAAVARHGRGIRNRPR